MAERGLDSSCLAEPDQWKFIVSCVNRYGIDITRFFGIYWALVGSSKGREIPVWPRGQCLDLLYIGIVE